MLPKISRVRVSERALLGILGEICVRGAEMPDFCVLLSRCVRNNTPFYCLRKTPSTHSCVFCQQTGLTLPERRCNCEITQAQLPLR